MKQWNKGVWLVAALLLVGWLWGTPPGLLGKADAVGYAVCHRIDVRSFHWFGRQLPLCARCTGMYLGAMLAFAFQLVVGARRSALPPLRVWAVMGALFLAFGVDGLNSYLHLNMMQTLLPWAPHLYEPSNSLRLFTGSGMGVTIALALLPVFNQTIWALDGERPAEALPAISDLRTLFVLLALTALLNILVLIDNPWVLYPLALISSLGVVVILTLVYTMVWVMVFRCENRYHHLAQLALPLAAGFTVALLQIAFLDAVRYWLTGSWAGFPLSKNLIEPLFRRPL